MILLRATIVITNNTWSNVQGFSMAISQYVHTALFSYIAVSLSIYHQVELLIGVHLQETKENVTQ